ncbi:L-2-amino-thiazoline-4-carboxylic acid hydrolase [Actinokineospora terrae]|uniref:L-2-amino-thiazoline-4-carboxylic acid hydrolase n=1 Tax=Actinokineospora terrae TaxID=155974 RepID=A0A1H9Q4D6_9PSEU|nr:L-2-amino-thiazoline-4-carboxylic acid hydrolase [Actinokineospora terrae]SER55278.1 hypothetical protein SAMN04487818_10479 [Actinokineospora terrae]
MGGTEIENGRVDVDTDADPGPPPLHEFWWLHDARWYQGVLRRFGQEAANEINAEAIRFVFRRIARWYRHQHGLDFRAMSLDEFVKWFAEIPKISWNPAMMVAEHAVTGDDEWESVITKNYALKMLAAARALDGYECPCPQMREGWFEGMGVTVRDSRVSCVRTGGEVCRFHAVMDQGS